MKFVFFTIVCLALVTCATSKILVVGQRLPGDLLAVCKKFVREGSTGYPGQPGAVVGWRFVDNINITVVAGFNDPGSNADISVVEGGPGNNFVAVQAFSPRGQGLNVHFEIYGVVNETQNYCDVDDPTSNLISSYI